jgi:hypothetical protein
MESVTSVPEIVYEVVELPDFKSVATAGGTMEIKSGSSTTYVRILGNMGFIWHVFGSPLGYGQIGEVNFTNVPGTLPVSACFGEWLPTTNTPHIGSASYWLIQVQRGRGNARVVGKNLYNANLVSAAGLTCFIE